MDEEENASDSIDGEPRMIPDDQHPFGDLEGDESTVPASDVVPISGDAVIESGQGRPGFASRTGPTFNQGGIIAREQSTKIGNMS